MHLIGNKTTSWPFAHVATIIAVGVLDLAEDNWILVRLIAWIGRIRRIRPVRSPAGRTVAAARACILGHLIRLLMELVILFKKVRIPRRIAGMLSKLVELFLVLVCHMLPNLIEDQCALGSE